MKTQKIKIGDREVEVGVLEMGEPENSNPFGLPDALFDTLDKETILSLAKAKMDSVVRDSMSRFAMMAQIANDITILAGAPVDYIKRLLAADKEETIV